MSRIALAGVLATAVVVGLTRPAAAALYQPDEPAAVPVNPDGTPEPLPFDEFKRRLTVLTNEMNPALQTEERRKLLDRVAREKARADRTPLDDAALAADLLRLGKSDDALNLLKPRSRDRVPNYYALATLAHVHAARGEWPEAVSNLLAAKLDSEPPAAARGLTRAQIDWQAKLDADYLMPLFRLLGQEAAARPHPDTEAVYPLFPATKSKGSPPEPVKFVNDAGQYEPGNLAAAEKAKLPPDALAVVQQLLLWFPGDTRLYWLLGELYAADGKLDEAQKVFDECVDARQYSNRKALMDHRTAVRAAVEERRRAEEQSAADAMPISMRTVFLYFGIVAALAVLAVLRTVGKRLHGGCGPRGCS